MLSSRGTPGRHLFAFGALLVMACSEEKVQPMELIELGGITIDSMGVVIERGSRDTLSATMHDRGGRPVQVPVVWRSFDETVAVFERGGVLVALDTGTTLIRASALGVTSQGVLIHVVWDGPARIDTIAWTRPSALNPGASLTDSMRVRVSNVAGAPVNGARVQFTVAEGGGTVSPSTVTTGANGIAAVKWTLGPSVGTNTINATVVRSDGSPDSLVADNLATFSIGAYDALTVVGGNGQTGLILSNLPTAPSVRLVDSLGAPRAGVPIVFSVSANGRVTQPVVSTNADGIASPGTWTLGDIPGEQQLEATVADARVVLRATGTGTPIHYKPSTVVAGANSSCALEAGGAVTCWGESPQNGSGSVTHTSTPTAVSGSLVAATLRGGASHFCAVTAAGRAWCWGLNALTDTTGAVVTTNAPLELMSDATWSSVSPGASHSCGLSAQVAYCWGNNQLGQLGDGTVPPPITRFTIRAVLGGFGFTQLSAGAAHNCGVSSGSAFCWGSNQFGQLGDGSIVTRLAPTAVAGGQNFLSVGAGGGFSCGLNSQGRVYCWGALVSTPGATPFTYPTAPNFTSLTVGGGHACALTTANEAYCWGNNDSGQLGDSTLTARANPTRVAGPLRFQQLSAGLTHTCGITTDGAVACWGQNRGGELGDNTSTFRTAPKHVVIGVQP